MTTNISKNVVDEINSKYSSIAGNPVKVTKSEIDSVFIAQIDRVWNQQTINFNDSTTRNLIEKKVRQQFPLIPPTSTIFSLLVDRVTNLTVTSMNQQVLNNNANQDVESFQRFKKGLTLVTNVIGIILIALLAYMIFSRLLLYTVGLGSVISGCGLLITGLITYLFKNRLMSPVPIIVQPVSEHLTSSFISYIVLMGIVEIAIGFVFSLVSRILRK